MYISCALRTLFRCRVLSRIHGQRQICCCVVACCRAQSIQYMQAKIASHHTITSADTNDDDDHVDDNDDNDNDGADSERDVCIALANTLENMYSHRYTTQTEISGIRLWLSALGRMRHGKLNTAKTHSGAPQQLPPSRALNT